MSDAMARYDEDLFLWSQQQAAALRGAAARGVNLPVDWENVAEEIEGLGKRDRSGIVSRLQTVIVHLLKLQHSPVTDPRRGWIWTVQRTRDELAKLLDESPSLRAQLPELMERGLRYARREAIAALEEYGEQDAARMIERAGIRYTVEEVAGDWLPPDPTA